MTRDGKVIKIIPVQIAFLLPQVLSPSIAVQKQCSICFNKIAYSLPSSRGTTSGVISISSQLVNGLLCPIVQEDDTGKEKFTAFTLVQICFI